LVPAQLVETLSVLLARELAAGVSLGQDVARPCDARALAAAPTAADDEPDRRAEHNEPEHREREPPEAALVPVRAGDQRGDVMESTHAIYATRAAAAPQRPQGGF
jgi:hypothetical protein